MRVVESDGGHRGGVKSADLVDHVDRLVGFLDIEKRGAAHGIDARIGLTHATHVAKTVIDRPRSDTRGGVETCRRGEGDGQEGERA